MRVRIAFAAGAVGLVAFLGAGAAWAGEDPGGEPTGPVEEPGGEIDFADHDAEECYDILVEGGTVDDCQEAPNPILPELNEIIWGGLAFLVLLGVLWKFGLPPIRNMVAQREDRIRADLERAEQAKVEAEGVLTQYQQQLADARQEAGRLIDEGRQAADQVRQDLIARAEADADEVRARAEEDTRLQVERAMADLRTQVADMSIGLAEKIVERNLDPNAQQDLIESYIAQVGNGNGSGS
jgi:F-type H+-transporting ATPase subunit b